MVKLIMFVFFSLFVGAPFWLASLAWWGVILAVPVALVFWPVAAVMFWQSATKR